MKIKSRSAIPVLLVGAAAGAGLVLLRSMRAGRHPEKSAVQRSISKALTKTLKQARREAKYKLDENSRYVILSDHHKGARNRADDFQPCEATYLAALDHYLETGYTLIVLGDAEELWEEKIEAVLESYRNVFESEARFYPDRYIRVHGNHDDAWMDEQKVQHYLYPFFPGIQFREGVVFEFAGDGTKGEIFMAHGYQGTFESDIFASIGQRFLPLYREFQNLTGFGKTTPAQDACLRAEHDSQMYRWSSSQKRVLFIAGHTDRPIWSSRTHLEKLLWEYYSLSRLEPAERPPDHGEKINDLKKDVKRREKKYPPCTDTIKTKPSYFNTGCCRFEDGDITGIELEGDLIRLIKWGEKEGQMKKVVLEEAPLSEIFFFL